MLYIETNTDSTASSIIFVVKNEYRALLTPATLFSNSQKTLTVAKSAIGLPADRILSHASKVHWQGDSLILNTE